VSPTHEQLTVCYSYLILNYFKSCLVEVNQPFFQKWSKIDLKKRNIVKGSPFAFFVFTGILDESGGSSFFFSSLDSRDAKIVQLPTATGGGDVPTDIEDDETIKV